MTIKHNKCSCLVIGESSLLIQCSKQLLKQKYNILGIVSSDQSVIEWAKNQKISYCDPKDNIIDFMQQQPFDYLFSIANLSFLSKEIIALPRQYAINYHDALLPKYAGLNATSWAIINQEKQHGVTWHVMTDKVDGGDILQQASVEINQGETAFTLNGKCYEAAISSFTKMIHELYHEKAIFTKQNKKQRSYFSRFKQSGNGFYISWNRNADEIDALVRGLDFGIYKNPLGLAKFFIEDNVIIVSKIKVTNVLSIVEPGTITAIKDNLIRVTTADYDIELRKLITTKQQNLSIANLVTEFSLHEGYKFATLDLEKQQQLVNFDAKIAKYEQFWVDRLATLKPLVIPYINYKNKINVKTSTTIKIAIPNEVTEFLITSTQKGNCSDFILTAFVAYIAKLEENSTFDIGISKTKLKNRVISFDKIFASHIPCRITIDKAQTVEDIFQVIQKQITLSQQKETYSYDVALRYPELASLNTKSLSIIVEKTDSLKNACLGKANDLAFFIQKDGKEYAISYNNISLTKTVISRIIDQFTVFIKNIVNQPTQSLEQQPLLSEQEYQRILSQWNNTQSKYPKHLGIHQLIERQTTKTPDAIAIIFENKSLTYKELNNKANQVAHYLQTLAVKPEVIVGLCVERSLSMLIGLLGILKAGGAYLPLDPAYPSERLAFILKDAGVDVLLTQQKWLDKLANMKTANLVCLDTQWSTISQQSEKNLLTNIKSTNLVYIIYTSGSTGKPKGVQITHQAFVNFLYAMHQSIGLNKQDILLAVTTLSFDIAGLELYLPLMIGAKIALVNRETALDGFQLLDKIISSKTTVMQATPATWQLLMNAGWNNQQTPDLKILCGGEALSRTLAEKLLSNGKSVWNLYGPTETTVWSSVYQVKQLKASEKDKNISEYIGRPIANTQLYILNKYLQPTPIGIIGELHIGGDGLARGYLNHPTLTSEKFIKNPFSQQNNSRLYKTGDLVRYCEDGNIEYISRIDHQVKIRGFRIEIGEIESQLLKHKDVQAAVVIAKEYPPENQNLIAYVVLRSTESNITNEQLLHHLRKVLPDYMIPALIIILNAMPLTPNGKIDRRNLPLPEMDNTLMQQVELVISPDFSTEQKLVAIWSSLLRRKHVGVEENFFEIGGNSLLATEVILKIRELFLIQLPVSKLFESPTIVALAKVINNIIDSNALAKKQMNKTSSQQENDPILGLLQRLALGELEVDEVIDNLYV